MDKIFNNLKIEIYFVHTNIVYVYLLKIVMKNQMPKCGCGNTQNPNGFCDGSHLNR